MLSHRIRVFSKLFGQSPFRQISGGKPGVFSDKEAAEESIYIHQHEQELLKKLKHDIEEREAHQPTTNSKSESKDVKKAKTESGFGGNDGEHIQLQGLAGRSGTGAFGKREGAIEDQYFRKHDQDLINDLKEKSTKKK